MRPAGGESAGCLHDKHPSRYFDEQGELERPVPSTALDLQKFGVDQRRLLKHPGGNNIRSAVPTA